MSLIINFCVENGRGVCTAELSLGIAGGQPQPKCLKSAFAKTCKQDPNPVSAVLRTSPPPHSARPVPHGRPVGPVISDLTTLWELPVLRAFLVCVLPPVPRCSGWASSSLISPSRISLPRNCSRVGLHIVLFEACSAFTRVAARTLAPSPICDQPHRRLQPFRHLHDCSGCFRLALSSGTCTHWKAPPSHGARRVEVWRGGVRLSMSVPPLSSGGALVAQP